MTHAAAGVWISVLMNSSFDAMTMASFFNCLLAPPPPTERELEEQQKATTARAEAAAADTEHKKVNTRV